jgi:hypothetical protein
VALRIVEESIAADPYHRVRRRERRGGLVVDFSAQGLFVAYRVVSPTVVRLVDVIDLKNPGGD